MQTAQVIDRHVREISINMITEVIICFWRHCFQTALHIIIAMITVNYRHLIHAYYIQEILLLSTWMWQAESSLHITLST